MEKSSTDVENRPAETAVEGVELKTDTAMADRLPEGFTIEIDQDGDAILVPPSDVLIFSTPGEGWLITDDYMGGRDWSHFPDLVAASVKYLGDIRPDCKE